MKHLIILLILLYGLTPAQIPDSGNVNSIIFPDTTILGNKTLSQPDSIKLKISADTLRPIYVAPLSSNSTFISHQQIFHLDYKYAGDLLNNFSFNYIHDFGFTGIPNETTIYGTGFNGISYFEDGLLYNNRFTNSLDLNLIQTESIDSIEIVPLPKGFLYGPYNNSVSVNFINKDFLSRPPYTRIKYYQGPFGEAMVDGFFNVWLYKRLNVSFDITNRKTDDRYTNSSFSLWQSRIKLKYLMSDEINVIGSFYYITSMTGLNGGIDLTQINGTQSEITSVIYDEFLAPVVYTDRTEQTRQINYNVKLLGKFTNNSKTALSLYYRNSFDGISGGSDTTYFVNTNRNNILGINLKHDISLDFFNLALFGNYEKFDVNYDEVSYSSHPVHNFNSSIYSVAGILSFNQKNSFIVPSIFYKFSHNILNTNYENSRGMGVDLRLSLFENFLVYAGYSFYNDWSNNDTKNFEVSVNYKVHNLNVNLQYFVRKDYNPNYSHTLNPYYGLVILNWNGNGPEANMNGLSGKINFKFGKFTLENCGTYYYNPDNSGTVLSSVPQYTYRGGIYYKDLLFNGNLDLKAGFIFYYNGKRASKLNSTYTSVIVDENSRLDFTFSGEIQKAAIIYFTWQNLLNQKYFIVPYYPMPKQSIRFGIAWELFN